MSDDQGVISITAAVSDLLDPVLERVREDNPAAQKEYLASGLAHFAFLKAMNGEADRNRSYGAVVGLMLDLIWTVTQSPTEFRFLSVVITDLMQERADWLAAREGMH